jgi:uncharacterized protein (TIGR01244 family)
MFGLFSNKYQQGPKSMNYRQINDDVAVAGQITVGDIDAIAKAGFKSVVCNRPDNEMGAVPHDSVASAAAAAGLQFRFIPVAGGMTQQNVNDMVSALAELPKPMLAYCRSGARSANLYMVASQAQR